MRSRSLNDWAQWIATLEARAPDNRRYRQFYDKVDGHFPKWSSVVGDPAFLDWASAPDSADGRCMLDRLYACWDDMIYGDRSFATLVRICAAGMDTSKPATTALQRLLRRKPNNATRMDVPLALGKYELLGLLGRGGNGEVYLAWSCETQTIYALKLIRREIFKDVAARAAFRREAETWISLGDHPNIAKAIYYEEINGQLSVTMEYVEGRDGFGPSLAERIGGDRVSEAQVSRWLMNVADGLTYAYEGGITAHRDIKPGNILITPNGIAQVSDFGLAISRTVDGCNEEVAGTPAYMAPEQFMPGHSIGFASDLYALGATFYEVLSGGRLPFMPRNTDVPMGAFIAALRELQLHSQPAPLDSPFWPAIARCLSRNPIDRYASVAEFRSAIAVIAATQGHPAPAPPVQKTELWTLPNQGNTLMRLGKYQEAAEVFERFLKTMPDEGVALNHACCLERLSRFHEAMQYYEHLIQRGDEAGLINGSNCLAHLDQPERALECAKRAAALYPESAQAWIALGNRLYSRQAWKEALAAYSSAGRISPHDPTPSYNAGLAALALDDRHLALRLFDRFLEAAMPDDSRREYVLRTKARLSLDGLPRP